MRAARRAAKGCRVEDSRTRHQRPTPCRFQPSPERPATSRRRLPMPPACPWVPASPRWQSWEGRPGTARHASRAPTASLRDLRPLTRTAPTLRSAAIGAMREVCPCA